VLVPDARAFVDATAGLLADGDARAALAAAAARAGKDLDWDVLARRFEHEVLDRYLPTP
jgi:glycosyltransferase involved in cell wall biosynthesis